jgi:hypothetical protein
VRRAIGPLGHVGDPPPIALLRSVGAAWPVAMKQFLLLSPQGRFSGRSPAVWSGVNKLGIDMVP